MNVSVIMCVRKEDDDVDFRFSCVSNGIDINCYGVTCDAKSMGGGYNRALRGLSGTGRFDDSILIFTHSDVRMWSGPKLWDDMLDMVMAEQTGFVGVAGSQGLAPSGAWWELLPSTPPSNQLRGAVAHENNGQTYVSSFGPFGEVVVMDGIFLACKSSVMAAIGPWPEDLGWHFYDIWATKRAHDIGYRNQVVPLPLLHMSIGETNNGWAESRDLYMRKYFHR